MFNWQDQNQRTTYQKAWPKKRFRAEVIKRYGAQCYYCGEPEGKQTLRMDHFFPEFHGGKSEPENFVPACGRCNSIKGSRTVEEMRPFLIQKMLGWPRFSIKQIEWLRQSGFDLSEYDSAKLWFERQPTRNDA